MTSLKILLSPPDDSDDAREVLSATRDNKLACSPIRKPRTSIDSESSKGVYRTFRLFYSGGWRVVSRAIVSIICEGFT